VLGPYLWNVVLSARGEHRHDAGGLSRRADGGQDGTGGEADRGRENRDDGAEPGAFPGHFMILSAWAEVAVGADWPPKAA
jgi:hypothetical protein